MSLDTKFASQEEVQAYRDGLAKNMDATRAFIHLVWSRTVRFAGKIILVIVLAVIFGPEVLKFV